MNFKIPDRLTFKRNEVKKITRLDGKVIDYWEREFGGVSPVINKLGEKFYTKKDIEIILTIKQMLIGEKKSKDDIKKFIKENVLSPNEQKALNSPKETHIDREKLNLIRKGLQEILTILDKRGK